MSQRTVLAAVAGAITLFALGFLTYVILLADFFADNGAATQEEPVFWAIIVGELVLASLITFIFSQWASISTFAGGLKGGAVIGAMLALGIGLIQFGAHGVLTLNAVAADTVISLIRYGVAGGVVGLMLGRE
jgi:hypothetical protein